MTLPEHGGRTSGEDWDSQQLLSLPDLFDNMSQLGSMMQLDELLPHLARIMARSVAAEQCTIFLYSQDLTTTTSYLRWGYTREQERILSQTDTFGGPIAFPAEWHVIHFRQTLQRIPGEIDDGLLPTTSSWREAGWHGDIMVPFCWQDDVVGIACVWLPPAVERFHPVQIEVAEGVARQAAGAINHLRVLEAERISRRQTEMLLRLSRALNNADSTADVYVTLAEAVRSTLGADAVSIVVEEPDEPDLAGYSPPMRRVAAVGLTDDEIAVRDVILRDHSELGSEIDRRVRELRQPLIVDDIDSAIGEPRLRENLRRHGVMEMLAAPIMLSGELRGVLYSWSRNGASRLARDQIPIIDTMTRHAAASIERVMLIESERRQRQRTEALLEVNHALGGSQDRDQVIQIATRAVRQTLNADLASAFMYDSGRSAPATLYVDGATEEEMELLVSEAQIPADTIPVEIELARTQRVLPIWDFADAFVSPLSGLPAHLARVGVERAVAVPVVSRHACLGVIYAWYRTPEGRFRKSDLEAVEAVAVQLAASLDRSTLMTSEWRERNRAETLLSFSKILNQAIRMDAVMGCIVQTIGELFPWARVHLALDRDDPQPEIEIASDLPFAGHSDLSDLLERSRESPTTASDDIDGYKVAAASLTVGPDVLGSILVLRQAPAGFSDDELELLAALAPQAANALRRARLFAVAERHIAELELLQEVGRTIATRSSLPDIFSSIADEIRKVVDYSTGIIALESSQPGHLEAVSVWGDLTPDRAGMQVPIDASILGSVYRSQRPVIVDDVGQHPNAWAKRSAVWRSVVCVPLMSGGTSIGAMLLGHREAGFFFDEDVRLASLLASQAGAAIYHARESERQRELYRAGVEALAAAVDAKDSYIHSHSRQVAELSRRTAEELGLGPEETERIELAGLLHDVGKIGIPDQILTKPGRLDAQERLIMISHATLGARIVAAHPSLAQMAHLVMHHHEWHNGSGYPDGLRGDDIPIGAAIIAVADAYASMTSFRPYRRPLSYQGAREELMKWSGTQFNPEVVEAFLVCLDEPAEPESEAMPDPGAALQPIQSIDIIAPRILSQISTEISHLTELYPFLNRVQQIVCAELKYDDVHILLTDETESDLILAASTSHPELVGRFRVLEGEGLTGTAAQTRSVINCGDVTQDPRARLAELETRAILVVPLVVEDTVIGVLGTGSAEPHRYDNRDVALMIAIAGQVAPTIRVAQLHDQAKRAAITDGLTGVMNHRAFYQRLETMIGELANWDDELHLLIVDVIGLKAINDIHGHLAGDRALRAIAGALKSRVRTEDEIARYGGDEFGVIVRGTPRAGLGELVRRIAAPVPFTLEDGQEMTVRLRCGYATAGSADDRATELVARADAGLYTQVRPTERLVLPDDA